jgi:hypothetical protein
VNSALARYFARLRQQNPRQAFHFVPGRRITSIGRYIDLKFGGTIFSAALICFNDLGFLSWVPEVPKAADLSSFPPACLLAAIRRVPVNYQAGQ